MLRAKAGVLFLTLMATACHQASNSPLSSFEPSLLKTDYQSYFRLIPSPEQSHVIYYVPTDGGILSENGKPRITVRQNGSALRFAGAFKTGGYDKILGSLRAELRAQGYVLAPAPIRKASADYLLAAKRLPSGRFDIKCDDSGAIQSCQLWDERTGSYSLSSTDIRRFQATFPTSGTVADRMFFNFEVDAETYRDQIQEFLSTGLEWDSFFIAKVDWQLNIRRPSETLTVALDWPRLADHARDVIRRCQGSCSELELDGWFEKLAETGSEGIIVREGDRRDLKAMFQKEIRSRLFVELTDRTSSQPDHGRFFTLRIAQGLDQTGTQDLIWEFAPQGNIPGSQESMYRIECLQGAVDQTLAWAPVSTFCPL